MRRDFFIIPTYVQGGCFGTEQSLYCARISWFNFSYTYIVFWKHKCSMIFMLDLIFYVCAGAYLSELSWSHPTVISCSFLKANKDLLTVFQISNGDVRGLVDTWRVFSSSIRLGTFRIIGERSSWYEKF